MLPIPILEKQRIINSIKTAIACLAGYEFARYFGIPSSWILITIIVIMAKQLHLGGVLIASWWRCLGTISGALIAELIIFQFLHNQFMSALLVFLSILIFSYLSSSKKNIANMGLLGSTTLIVILLGSDPSYHTVVLRFMEIMLGIVIAFLVARFIWPLKASRTLRRMIADNIESFITLYESAWKANINRSDFIEQEIKFIKNFAEQAKLVEEAVHEYAKRYLTRTAYNKAIYGERLIFRYICVTHTCLTPSLLNSSLPGQMQAFNQKLALTFRQMADDLREIPVLPRHSLISKEDLYTPMEYFKHHPEEVPDHLAFGAFFFTLFNLVKATRLLARLIIVFVSPKE